MSGGLVPDQAGGGERSFHRVIAPAGVGGRRCETALARCSLGSQSRGSEVKPQLRPFFSCMCGFCPRNQKVNEGVFQAVPLTVGGGGRGVDPDRGCCFPLLLRDGPKLDQTLADFS